MKTERILMIDDDTRLSEMLVDYLGARGLEAVARADAASGLLELERGGFAAVVLDVMLPDGDGFEVCRTLRARSDVPILMLTARGDEEDRIVGLELGADDYLPKPFNPRDALMNLVRGESLEAFDRSIDVHVSRIRAAIEDDPRRPRRLLTLRGAGYVFARR